MKYILILLICFGGYYVTKNGLNFGDVEVKTHRDIYRKMDASSVTSKEVIIGFREHSTTLCNDQGLQAASGKSVDLCLENLDKFSERCADSILGSGSNSFSDKKAVALLSKRFVNCVGVMGI